MRARNAIWIGVLAALTLLVGPAGAQGAGQIEGKIVRENDQGIGGVTVVVSELGLVEITNNDGDFRFPSVAAGTYNLTFSLGDNQESESVVVTGGQVATVAKKVFAGTSTSLPSTPRARRMISSAAVPLPTATACATPQRAANPASSAAP